ncbi:iron complex outermembrane receptor protein [Chitinophaga terrae (ex Kim and Jung 2007)]|jgi:iron complex outermembrane receptor protein|uniref:TonB-dependent receptor n=1 Tax=Chitinophaga terrae (ex Kim and Jung 2007) TaxID=408074 RepID=UPI002783B4A6|nr:TonB-dependent receptor [Chitinophaga terrae (ex Kim and Jung 2007)]MDQ0109196.1 iron complex outermembrane receptor protein [Chitinophaga terrae (ex Kim and Jung 2007)]
MEKVNPSDACRRRPVLRKYVLIMKLSFFIVFLSCMQVAATGYSQRRISLDLKNTEIKRVLDRIAGQSTVHFLYSNRKVDLQQKIDVQAHGEALDVVLNKVLDGTGFTWKELDNELVVIIPANTAWDNIKVKGRIVSADENEPLPGVTVQVKGTSIGTLTDADGKFSIDAPAGGQLVFRYVGYEVMELPVKANMDVQLKKSSSALTEVVVIGYGVTQKKDLTGSVVSVTPKEFNKGIISNPVQVLQGKVAGLVISKPGGNPNGKVSISLRGASSLSASSQPLFVVDGIPGIDINAVPPDDIVSIDVLKDASAAAIYGSRGANGVIMVTTRRGKDGAPQVSYSGYIGIDRISNTYDVLSADQYRQYLKDNNLDARAWDLGSSTDWQKAVTRTGLSHSHNISMSGGKDNTRYSASVNYLNNEGVVLNSGLERIIGRITLDQGMFNNRLRLGLSMNYVGEKNRYAGQDQDGNGDNRIWEQMIAYNPTAPVYNADGTFYEKLDINDNYNPVALANQIKHQRAMNKFIGSAKATYDITKHLTYDLLLGLERASSDRGLYYSKESPVIEGAGSNGTATRASRTWDNKTLETYFTYNQQWQKNTLKVTAGYSYQNFFTNSMSAGNTQFVSDIFSYNNLGAGQGDQPAVSSGAEENSLVSFIGRAFYSYQDKYLLTATVRRDGSTRFGKDRKWGTFPSASLAWRLTQEPFLQNSSWLQDLKLRVGYGVTGNQEISNYKSPLTYAPGGKVLDNGRWVTSYQIGQNENPNLRWESAAQFNAGFDFVMFKGRLNGTIEYYDKRTKDLLFNYNVPSPPYLFPSMLANVGKISNKGVEVSLSGSIIEHKDFSWNASFNISRNFNNIISIANDQFKSDAIYDGTVGARGLTAVQIVKVVPGYSIGTFYIPHYIGIDANGNQQFEDIDGSGTFDFRSDSRVAGNGLPKYQAGFANTFRYKNFDLNFLLRSLFGYQLFNATDLVLSDRFSRLPGRNAMAKYANSPIKGTYVSDRFIENGAFLRLDNFTLGYNIPAANSKLFANPRVYISGQNLFILTKYSGLDPELPIDGLAPGIDNRNIYPKTRSFALGFTVNFK